MIGAILNFFFDESFQVTKNNSSERTSALMPGDFIIGVLFSLRHQPKQKKTGPNHFLACGEVIWQIQNIQAISDKIFSLKDS